jgi:hypothetical protein
VTALKEIRRTTSATPQQVFAVLGEGWLFPSWVVGASRMRAVDATWPQVGARLHHSFGVWPAVIDDETTVLINEAPHRLVMQPQGWPVGEATVEVRVDAWGEGAMVTITEDATKGPGLLIPALVRQWVLALRNRETLRRLIWLAEGGANGSGQDERG